jgi:hypothetical protein
MNCQECLSELATGSLRNLTPESEVMRHCTTCPDCGPLSTLLRDREYNAATVLNSLPAMSNPITIAQTAGELARRRRVGKVVVFLTGAALVGTMWTALFVTGIGRSILGLDHVGGSPLVTETIQLSCLSPEQAGDIISPYIRSDHSNYWVGKSGLSAITVRATAAELAKSRELIRQFESSPGAACRSSPFDVVDKMLKRYGGPPPDPGSEPVATPTADANPTPDVPTTTKTKRYRRER